MSCALRLRDTRRELQEPEDAQEREGRVMRELRSDGWDGSACPFANDGYSRRWQLQMRRLRVCVLVQGLPRIDRWRAQARCVLAISDERPNFAQHVRARSD